jgi:hypothetical protein
MEDGGGGLAARLDAPAPGELPSEASEGLGQPGPHNGADPSQQSDDVDGRDRPLERLPDVDGHRGGGEGEEKAQSATPSTMSGIEIEQGLHEAMSILVHLSLRSPGNYLRRYSDRILLDTFRAEWSTCFSTDRPLTALFTLWLARVFCVLLGIMTVTIYPWMASYEDLKRHGVVMGKVSMLRFTGVAQRDPTAPNLDGTLNMPSFGLLRGACKITANPVANSTANANAAIVSFSHPVEDFDGWYFVTSTRDAALDPQVYLLEGSSDGTSWWPMYSSLKKDDCGCARRSQRPVHGLTQMGPHQDYPRSRLSEERVDLNRQECAAPMLVWAVSNVIAAFGLVLAPAMQTVTERMGRKSAMSRPLQVIAVSCLASSLLRLAAFGWTFERGWELQAVGRGYSDATMLAEGLLVTCSACTPAPSPSPSPSPSPPSLPLSVCPCPCPCLLV